MTVRILVVDDAPQIRRVLQAALVGAGYEVWTASSATQAWDLFAAHRPELVILDLGLPDMPGMELAQRLRSASEVAILVLSVREREADKIQALDAGADDYLTKPFAMGELLARIRSALRRRSREPESLEAGSLRLDPASHRAWLGARELRLTPKEFDLLRQLVLHAGRVLTHRALLQAVWGPDYGDQSEYLRVFINQLRKKIEVDPSHPELIRTEPWVGYRLAVDP